jgi:hypothetical protein
MRYIVDEFGNKHSRYNVRQRLLWERAKHDSTVLTGHWSACNIVP